MDNTNNPILKENMEMVDGRQPKAENPILAPYHRTIEEVNRMPVLEVTKTVCPE